MKKWIFALVLAACLSISAFAAATVQSQTAVDTAGQARVTITLFLDLETAPGALRFPLPEGAAGVQVNGSSVSGKGGAVSLSCPAAGSYTFTVSYRLSGVLERTKEGLSVSLPLLSGFALPIDSMTFSVTLPGAIEGTPQFTSAYHGQQAGQQLTWSIEGPTLSGTVTERLNDHETLLLQLPVKAGLFPQWKAATGDWGLWGLAMATLLSLSVLYYILFLWPSLPRREYIRTAPEGITAGHVGACISGCGLNLTLMAFSWARLGYLEIALEGRRITLTRRMDMGNERSDFEVHAFNALFHGRSSISGQSSRYAMLCRKAAANFPLKRELFLPKSGNPAIFRTLAGLGGFVSGVCLSLSMGVAPVWQVILGIFFALLAACLSFLTQEMGRYLLLRERLPVYLGLGSLGAWLLLGLIAGNLPLAAGMAAFQLLTGLAAAFGGRRSDSGKWHLNQLLGLRRYLMTAPAMELQRLQKVNPNYFFELLPYALALGVDRQFARKFGRMLLLEGSFLHTDSSRERTAREWAALARQTADSMDALYHTLRYKQFFRK